MVKAILGDLLQENYTIAPNVGGNVTFSTSKPIRRSEAMPVLEMLLSCDRHQPGAPGRPLHRDADQGRDRRAG